MGIYSNPNDFRGFDELVNSKKKEVEAKALLKADGLQAINDLNAWDGDSSEKRATNADGVRLGGSPNVSLDAYETAKYNNEGDLLPYLGSVDPTDGSKRSKKWNLHRASYSKMNGVPAEQVTQQMLNAEGDRQALVLQEAIAAGQGHYQQSTGKVLRDPAIDPVLQAQDPKQAAIESLLNPIQTELSPGNYQPFDPKVMSTNQGTGYFGRQLEELVNPVTGVNINEQLNTPEQNASFYSKYNSDAKMRDVNDTVVLRHARDRDYDDNDLSQTEIIPKDVESKGVTGQVDLITNEDGFSVYYPKTEDRVGFYKDDLTLAQATKWKKAIEANPNAEHRAAESIADYFTSADPWSDSFNRLSSGATAGIEGLKRAADLGPLTRTEGVEQWNDYIMSTNQPTNPGEAPEAPLDINTRITATDQADFLNIAAKSLLGEELTEEEVAFTKQEKYTYLNDLSGLVSARQVRDAESLSIEEEAAGKVNRRTSNYQNAMAEEIFNDSGWDYLVYSLGNRKMSAAHNLVESAFFMAELAVPYVGMAAAIATAQENMKRQYVDINGEVPTGSDAALLDSLAVVSSFVEKLGLKAITGKLPGLTNAISTIGIKNPLLANIVKPLVAVIAPPLVEGVSGLTSTTAETVAKHGIAEDGSITLPTSFEAAEGFVNEAMAGATLSTPLTVGKTVLQSKTVQAILPEKIAASVAPSTKTVLDKLNKRNELINSGTLTEKQKIRVDASRDDLIKQLMTKRDVSIKSFIASDYKDAELAKLDVEAYLDEVNVIAATELGLDNTDIQIDDVAQMSYALLDKIKKMDTAEIAALSKATGLDKAMLQGRLTKALVKGLKRYEEQQTIDIELSKVNAQDINEQSVVDTINSAKERARLHSENQAKAQIDYITQDYAQRTAEEPHKKGLFEVKRDKEIKNVNDALDSELDEIGVNAELSTAVPGRAQKTEIEAKEASRGTYERVANVDVGSANYDPIAYALESFKELEKEGVNANSSTVINFLANRNNLQLLVDTERAAGKSDAVLETQLIVLEQSNYLLENIATQQQARKDAVPNEASNTDKILHSIDPDVLDTEAVNTLPEAELTDDQKAIKTAQVTRAEINAKRDKNVKDVREEIMSNQDGQNVSFDKYAKKAENGEFTPAVTSQFENFLRHQKEKAEVLQAAYEKVAGTDSIIWVPKKDLKGETIFQELENSPLPEGLTLDNVNNTDKVVSHYKIGSFSKQFVEQVNIEATYGEATKEVITKVLAAKDAIVESNTTTFSKTAEAEITRLQTRQQEEVGDLSTIQINEEVAPTTTPTPVKAEETPSPKAVPEVTPITDTKPIKAPRKEPEEVELDTEPEFLIENFVDSIPAPVDIDVSNAKGIPEVKAEVIPVVYMDKVVSAVDNTKTVAARTDRKNKQILVNKAEVQRTFDNKAWTNATMEGVVAYKADDFKTVEEWESFIVAHERAHFTEANLKLDKGPLRENHANSVAYETVIEMRKVTDLDTAKTETVLEQYTDTFVPMNPSHAEGNLTDYFEIANPKRKTVISYKSTGPITKEDVTARAEKLVEIANKKRKTDGKEVLEIDTKYLDYVYNTFDAFRDTYAKQGPSTVHTPIQGVTGASNQRPLEALHIINAEGKDVLPDEVMFAVAMEALNWLSTDLQSLGLNDDTRIKQFLDLDRNDKLFNEERQVFKNLGVPVYSLTTDLGNNIIRALNIKAKTTPTKNSDNSPLEFQNKLADNLGMLVISLLSQIDASDIAKGEVVGTNTKEPFILLASGNPKVKQRENNPNGFDGSKSINTIIKNESLDSKQIRNILKFLRAQTEQSEVLTGAQVSKNGVFNKPVTKVQKTIKGTLSGVDTRTQKMLLKLQTTPQGPMKGPMKLFKSLSLDQQKELVGVVDEVSKHEENKDSYQASNEALIDEINSINDYDQDTHYYEYRIQKQGRTMIKSSGINPMNSKVHRHLLAAKSNPTLVNNPKLRSRFKVAVAAAFGASIDKQSARPSVEFFDALLDDVVIKDAIKVMQNPASTDAELAAAVMSVHQAKDANGKTKYANKVHLLEGLAALSVYRPKLAFTTDITAEIDGITNGYAISLLQYGGPNLTRDLERVGVFTFDTEYGQWLRGDNNQDVYQELATEMASVRDPAYIFNFAMDKMQDAEIANQKRLGDILHRLSTDDDKLKPNVLHSIEEIHGEIFDADGITKFARDLAKDPLMTTNYGARMVAVLSQMSDNAVFDMFDKLADIQEQYKTGDKDVATSKAERLDRAISTLLGRDGATLGFVEAMKAGTLANTLTTSYPKEGNGNSSQINTNREIVKQIKEGISFVYEPMLEAGLSSLLGTYDDNNASLMSRNLAVTQASEWIFFNYLDAYTEQVEKLDKVTPEAKRDIARSMLTTYYPTYKGPWHKDDKETDAFIAFISTEKTPKGEGLRNKLNILNDTVLAYGQKEKSNFPNEKIKTTKSMSTPVLDDRPASAGSKVQANVIQNLDAALIGAVSEQLEFLTLYDAGQFSLKDLDKASQIYNDEFIKLNKEHRVIDIMLEDLKRVAELARKDGRSERVRNLYRGYTEGVKGSHQAKLLNKVNLKAVSALNIGAQIATLTEIKAAVDEEIKVLDNVTVVNQLYWPSFTDVDSVDIETSKLNSLNDNGIVKDINKLYNRNSLSRSTQEVFDFLGTMHTQVYGTPEERSAHSEHLESILQMLVIPSTAILDNTSILLNETSSETKGTFNTETNNVTVNISKYAPTSYTGQSPQEVYLHELIHAITHKAIAHDNHIKQELKRLYRELRSGPNKITWEDFMHPEVLHSVDIEEKAAKRMFEYVFGNRSTLKNELDEFMAYALTNPALIRKLRSMDALRESDSKELGLLERFFSLLRRAIDSITNTFYSNRKRPTSVHDQITQLAKEITDINAGKKSSISRFMFLHQIGFRHNKLNTAIIDFAEKHINKGVGKSKEIMEKRLQERKKNPSKNRVVRFVKSLENLPLVATYMTQSDQRDAVEKMHYRFRGEIASTVRSFLSEITGITPQQFLNMVLESRHAIDGSRALTKESIATMLRKSFVSKVEPSELELESITRVLLKTDASSLLLDNRYSAAELIELIRDPKKLATAVTAYSNLINLQNNPYYAVQIEGKSDEMITGETETRQQYLNAHSIVSDKQGDVRDEANIDILITLMALTKTIKGSPNAVEKLLSVADREFKIDAVVNGVSEMLLQHNVFKADSLSELFSDNKALMTKGYIATITDSDTQLVVEPLMIAKTNSSTGAVIKDANGNIVMIDNEKLLRKKGYKKIENLKGIAGIKQAELGLFIGSNIPEVPRTKGINSVTSFTHSGTSLKEMIARNPAYEGIVNKTLADYFNEEEKLSQNQMKGGKTKGKVLIPIYNDKNEITDYRVKLSHANVEEHLKQEMSSIDILAHMFMHKVDKVATVKINKKSVKVMVADATKNRTPKNSHKWVNILDAEHIEEYFTAMNKQMRYEIMKEATYNSKGKAEFFVQKGLLDTIFGFRHRTIMNAPLIKDMPRAQHIAGIVEKAIKSLVRTAVVAIVIKIPMVLRDNLNSNIMASLVNKVPPKYLAKHITRGWQELETYRDNMEELVALIYKVKARPELKQDAKFVRKMAELTEDINSSDMHMFMSAGLFTSITEDIHSFDFSTRNKVGKAIKNKLGFTVPKTITQVVGMAYLTQDTKVGKAMIHATQISDFLFRYAMYKHKTEQQNWTHDKAWELIMKTFVNYDQAMNRNIQYLNDIGLVMFVRYWMRIQSVIWQLGKKEPLNFGLFLAAESMLDIDSPDVSDSSILGGKFMPTDGGISKVLKEVLISPAWEIATGEGL